MILKSQTRAIGRPEKKKFTPPTDENGNLITWAQMAKAENRRYRNTWVNQKDNANRLAESSDKRKRVFEAIKAVDETSTEDLSASLGFTKASINSHIRFLMEHGFVRRVRYERTPGKGGRFSIYAIKEEAA